jgi:hypothetical protein
MLKQVQHDGRVSEEMLSYRRGNMHDAIMVFDPSAQTPRIANRHLIVTPKAPLSVTFVTISGEIGR